MKLLRQILQPDLLVIMILDILDNGTGSFRLVLILLVRFLPDRIIVQHD